MKNVDWEDIFSWVLIILLVFSFSTLCVKIVETKMLLEIQKIKHK